jgi:arsenite oxidase small subunit
LDRRGFIETCSAGVTCATAVWSLPAWGADAKPRPYGRVLLTDEFGDPLKTSGLKALTNYVFHYPFESTPAFLLNLGRPAPPVALATSDHQSYAWPGGVGPQRSLVAFSAICAHQLVYPTRDVSFISFRRNRAAKGVQDNLIHCCADHSQYDPARGAQVMGGPAPQPLCTVLLEHEAKTDQLFAWGTLGGELFEAFFRKYEFKLGLEVGPRARQQISGRSAVRELEKYCRNPIQC